MKQKPGATQDDWTHFDLVLGLGEDLLPVVSDKTAQISEKSTMKQLGKTPSLFNWSRKVVGFPKWTGVKAVPRQIEDWSQEPAYGICIQTRRLRAIDIDVDEEETVHAILRKIMGMFPDKPWPSRGREASCRVLLPFWYDGELRKRVVKVDGGMVEWLATGQQFIAAGTHQPSGKRYTWMADGVQSLPAVFPTLTEEEMERLWDTLVDEFGIADPSIAGKPREITDLDLTGGWDEVADWLVENGRVLEQGRDHRLYFTCPFQEDHSMDSGITETAYFPAGTGGYEQGHFKCMHAHCDSRDRTDFLEGLGYAQDQFDELPIVPYDPLEKPGGVVTDINPRDPALGALPKVRRNDKTGMMLADRKNMLLYLSHPKAIGWRLAWDSFHGMIVKAPATDTYGSEQWQVFTDRDFTRMGIELEWRGFGRVQTGLLKECIKVAADDNAIDTGAQWLNNLEWDGVPRIHRLLPDYMKAPDTPYTEAVSLYAMTAHAGRVLTPGCKADMVPVLIGPQGARKTSAVIALAPNESMYTEIDLTHINDNLLRQMRGKVVGELGELRGLHDNSAETIKSFLSRSTDEWTDKYEEMASPKPRRLVLWATGNSEEILADPTGARRWLPTAVCQTRGEFIDVDGIIRDREQLWAEAAVVYREKGVLYAEAERLAKFEHHKFEIYEAFHEELAEWLEEESIEGFTNGDRPGGLEIRHAAYALGFERQRLTKVIEMRIGRSLSQLGYEKRKSNGKRVWKKVEDDA